MSNLSRCSINILRRPLQFLLRVVKGFKRNQGLLLSGAVAYYTLLSIVPLIGLLLVGLSHFYDEEVLLLTVSRNLDLLLPAQSQMLAQQISAFVHNKEGVGWVVMLVLLFFSTLAFTVLENAISVIFFHRVNIHRRHFMVSALIPFLFIFVLGVGLLLVTFISGALQALEREPIEFFGEVWSLDGSSARVLYGLGIFGMALMLTAFYLVMPVGQIALRHALAGGVTAALLWELTRHALVWYFSTLSLVNVVYGSLASAVVVLLSFEAAALILLFGAQVIAEFERCSIDAEAEAGLGFQT